MTIDWLNYLPKLIPATEIITVAHLPPDHPVRIKHQENTWYSISVLKALHIEAELKQVLDGVNIQNSAHVLDLGCGAGVKARFLLDSGAKRVTGVDIARDELSLARKLPNPHGDRLQFIEADALDTLPFADSTFDTVFIGDGFIDFYDEAVFAEIERVLRAEGNILCATTNILPSTLYGWDRPFAAQMENAHWDATLDTGYAEYIAATGSTYEGHFLEICAAFGFKVTHIPVIRSNPVPAAFEQLIQQTFSAFTSVVLRPYIEVEAWETLLAYHDPESADYLFQRSDATFVELLTVASRHPINL